MIIPYAPPALFIYIFIFLSAVYLVLTPGCDLFRWNHLSLFFTLKDVYLKCLDPGFPLLRP